MTQPRPSRVEYPGPTPIAGNGPEATPVYQTPYRRRRLSWIRITSDALALTLAGLAALLLRFRFGILEVTESSPLTVRAHVTAALLWVAAGILMLAVNRLYDEDTLFRGGGETSRVVHSVVEAFAILSVFVFLTQSFYVSRSWFAITAVLSVTLVVIARALLRRHLVTRRSKGEWRRPAILVSRETSQWEEWPLEQQAEFDVIARVEPAAFDDILEAMPSIEGFDTAVILRARDFTSDEFWKILLKAGQRRWSVFVHSPVRSVGRDRLTVRELSGQTIVKVAPPSLVGWRALQKRSFDVVLSVLGLLLLAPVMIGIAGAIALSSGRPILYPQERVGVGGRTFRMWKFRTMAVNAEAASGPVWAVENDPRRTPLGAPLRRTSLDELPQLWNVLRGDMSLIGPRPERPSFVDEFSTSFPWYQFRHRIRPGITGWAQARGLRGNTELDIRVQSDNWYIENWSIWLDLKILIATVAELARGRNAY